MKLLHLSILGLVLILAPMLRADDAAPAFTPYEVAGIGTVIAHDGGSYVVRLADGRVVGYAAPGGEPSEATAAADIAAAIANPPAAPARASWLDEITGISVGVTSEDQAKFTADVAGFSAKSLVGELDLDSDTTIVRDVGGGEHTLSVRAYLQLIARLHDALRAQWETGG